MQRSVSARNPVSFSLPSSAEQSAFQNVVQTEGNITLQIIARGCLDSQVVATTPARSEKVYCPTDVRFNGESYPASITGELAVSWSHRNRLGTWSYADSGLARLNDHLRVIIQTFGATRTHEAIGEVDWEIERV